MGELDNFSQIPEEPATTGESLGSVEPKGDSDRKAGLIEAATEVITHEAAEIADGYQLGSYEDLRRETIIFW